MGWGFWWGLSVFFWGLVVWLWCFLWEFDWLEMVLNFLGSLIFGGFWFWILVVVIVGFLFQWFMFFVWGYGDIVVIMVVFLFEEGEVIFGFQVLVVEDIGGFFVLVGKVEDEEEGG